MTGWLIALLIKFIAAFAFVFVVASAEYAVRSCLPDGKVKRFLTKRRGVSLVNKGDRGCN